VTRTASGVRRRAAAPRLRRGGTRTVPGMATAKRLRRLGKGKIHLFRPKEPPPEEATRLLVPRREVTRPFQGRLQIHRGNAQVGGQTSEADPGLGQKIC
jgi:hypothetical protein